MNSRRINLNIILTMTLLVINSCTIEDNSSVQYILQNKTTNNLKIVKHNGWDSNFKNGNTLLLAKDTELILYYDDMGGPPSPFSGIDSISISVNDTLEKTYSHMSAGKNPLDIDSYQSGKTGSKKHNTSYQFTYMIESEDFILK